MRTERVGDGLIIAIDGPVGAGKSTEIGRAHV